MVLIGAVGQVVGLGTLLILTLSGIETRWTFFGFMTFLGLGNGLVIPNATAGMLSVRPHLAGTASGLGGAMMIGGGAALSVLAGRVLATDHGTWPLVALMTASGIASVVSIVLTIRRNRRLAAV